MATTSPYDGVVGSSSDDVSLPTTFVHSIKPPAMPEGRLRRVAFHVLRWLMQVSRWLVPLLISVLAGVGGIAIYLVSHPLPDGESRRFKLFPPWSDEVWVIAGSFIFCAGIMFLIVARFRRQRLAP